MPVFRLPSDRVRAAMGDCNCLARDDVDPKQVVGPVAPCRHDDVRGIIRNACSNAREIEVCAQDLLGPAEKNDWIQAVRIYGLDAITPQRVNVG